MSVAQPIMEWDRTFGGSGWEECQAMIRTSDYGYLFGGITLTDTPAAGDDVSQSTYGGGDFWVVKVDLEGNLEWERRYGGDAEERIWSMVEAEDGNFVLGGISRSSASGLKTAASRGEADYWIIKVDATNGDLIWEYTYGSTGEDILRGIAVTKNGYLMAGYSNSPAGFEKSPSVGYYGGHDYWVIEINEAGNILRQRTYGSDQDDILFTFTAGRDGNFVLAGASQGGVSGSKDQPLIGVKDWWIVSTDGDLDERWQTTLGGDEEESPLDIFQTLDGSYAISGNTASQLPGMTYYGGDTDVWVVKLDGNTGTMIWEQTYGGDGKDWGYSIRENGRGKFVVAASSTSGISGVKTSDNLGLNDYWLIYLDADGSIAWPNHWQVDWGGELDEVPVKIENAHDGGFIIAGHSRSPAGTFKSEDVHGPNNLNDFWIVKTNCQLEPPQVVRDTLLCERETVEIDLRQYICGECFVNWTDGSTDAVRSLSPEQTTEFVFYITHEDGCEIQQEIDITVLPAPTITGVESYERTCEESDIIPGIRVTEISGGTEPFLFQLNEESFVDTTEWQYLEPDTYELVVEDASGCRHDTTLLINAPQDLILDLGPNQTIALGDSLRLEPYANFVLDSFAWSHTNNLSCSDCPFPFIRPLQSTPIALQAWTPEGCTVSHGFWITVVEERAIFAPTGFSPNGDGDNDFYMIYADNSVTEVADFKIFDRWGQLVYARQPLVPGNEPDGWDGHFRGRPQRVGTYVWYADVIYVDGRREVISGSFSLVR